MTINKIQETLLKNAKSGVVTCVERARICQKENLMTLAREYDHFAKQMTLAIERQMLVFQDDENQGENQGENRG